MKISLGELARIVGGQTQGDKDIQIQGVARADEAKEGDITFAVSDKFLCKAMESHASAVIVPLGVENFPRPTIRVRNPRLAFAQILELFAPACRRFSGIHPTAVIGENVVMGRNVTVGPYAVVGNGVRLEDDVYLSAAVYLGDKVSIGQGSFLYPQVTILDDTVIGKSVIIHSGTVIGSDGFGFVRKEDGSYYKIPQVGRVVIGDEVEIGANVAIDRATLGETCIGAGCKIDNLVHVAHNAVLGKNVILVALVGISGSSTLGDGVIMAGQAGVTEHVKIGDNVIVAAKSGVTKDIPSNQFVSGFPARSHSDQKRVKAIVNRLPRLLKKIKELEARLKRLERG